MTTGKVLRFLLLACVVSITALMAGCKLAVIVVEGGEVQSVGSGTCLEGTICIHQVDDTSYTETFTAVPSSGWVFEKWNSGNGFFCQGSTDPICVVSGEGTEGNEGIEAIVASDKTFYIMPIFVQPQQMADAVTIDGKYWLQPQHFRDYSYSQVSEVCPDGACSGRLPGSTIDLTGYTWASIEEISALFNAYGVDPPFTGPFQTREKQAAAAKYFEDFEYLTDMGTWIQYGMVRDRPPGEDENAVYATVVGYSTYEKTGDFSNAAKISYAGWGNAWFWRPEK
jgi:hypothetical protein